MKILKLSNDVYLEVNLKSRRLMELKTFGFVECVGKPLNQFEEWVMEVDL